MKRKVMDSPMEGAPLRYNTGDEFEQPPSASLSLMQLPQEVLLRTFSFLPVKDVANVALTCHECKNLAEDDIYLWRKLTKRVMPPEWRHHKANDKRKKPSNNNQSRVGAEEQQQPANSTAQTDQPHNEEEQEEEAEQEDLSKVTQLPPYQLPKNPFPDRTWKWLYKSLTIPVEPKNEFTGTGVHVQPKEGTYRGEWKDGKRHGKGHYTYGEDQTAVYVGDWEEDKQSGEGVLAWRDGGYYKGSWKDSAQEGFGVFVSSNGFTFEGIWTGGELQSQGRKWWRDAEKLELYEGTFKDTRAEGFGERTYGNGAKYYGYYKADRRVGTGCYVWPNGDQFFGNFLVGRAKGRFIRASDGKEFQQEWNEAQMDPSVTQTPNDVEVTNKQHLVKDAVAIIAELNAWKPGAEKPDVRPPLPIPPPPEFFDGLQAVLLKYHVC
ncbi:2-isopropylmalate synthase [Balamuthia mandrillaris]